MVPLTLLGADPVRYFVVGELTWINSGYNESYILPLIAPEDIEHARFLIDFLHREEVITDPTKRNVEGAIVISKINLGYDSINRNYLEPNAPLWNWNVVAFEEFADVVAPILGGRPSFIDSSWIELRGPYIGFTSYSVIGELPLQFNEYDENFNKVGWIGNFNDSFFPWIWHQEHGWWYVFGLDPFDIWFWTQDMGFLWTNESIYPFIYRLSDNTWMWFLENSTDPRYFYNFATGQWEEQWFRAD